MPGGQAWDEGARPGMIVLMADGQTPDSAAFSPEVSGRAELRTLAGENLLTELTTTAIGQSPAKYSLWALGGMFMVLGWAVVLRRPDLVAARIFGVFAGFAAIALGVSPAAGGTSPSWSVAINFLALVRGRRLSTPIRPCTRCSAWESSLDFVPDRIRQLGTHYRLEFPGISASCAIFLRDHKTCGIPISCLVYLRSLGISIFQSAARAIRKTSPASAVGSVGHCTRHAPFRRTNTYTGSFDRKLTIELVS